MAREELSRDDQEQIDYINAWWEMKLEKQEKKREQKKRRKLCLIGAKYHVRRAAIELKQYFKLLLNLE